MRRILLALALAVLLAPLLARAARAASDETTPASAQTTNIQQLIADLGSDSYALRRRAEELLLQMGPEAFDELKNAEHSHNLEIAERASYIVQRMHVQWARPEDPAEVRRLLAHYGNESVAQRSDRIRQLARLDENAGLAAICRIARFDQSPLVARKAAITILKRDLSADERHAAAPAWDHELAASDRAPAHWIRLYLREPDAPVETIADWAAATAAEAELFKAKSTDTDFMTLQDLLLRQLDRCDKLKLESETMAALLAVVDLTAPDRSSPKINLGLDWALRWVIRHKRWDVLKLLDAQFEDQFRKSRLLLYDLAAAADKAGDAERATSLAEQAFNLPESSSDPFGDELEGNMIADTLVRLGRIDWAQREYRRVIDSRPVIDRHSMEARSDLATWLHDAEKFQEAADVLGEFCDAIDADRQARQKLIDEIEAMNRPGSDMVREITARREFYLACVDEANKDYDSQRKRLENAAKKYDKDPDILIAMYRSPDADDGFRRRTRVRIRVLSTYMQALVDENTDNPSVYNQWAWLIANTEGEQDKAVKYSLRSLELAPNEPSYLDTLGRCYFAVGNYEKAVENQRRAVELAPQYNVMKRQLALFEKTLAEKGPSAQATDGSSGEGSGDGSRPESKPPRQPPTGPAADEDPIPAPDAGPTDPFGADPNR